MRAPSKPPNPNSLRLLSFAAAAAILLAVSAVYSQTHRFPFVAWDDDVYYAEPLVRAGLTAAGFKWAFTETSVFYWHPLTLLSHQGAWAAFGAWAGGHHLLNVALHALNAWLLFVVWKRLTAAPVAAFTAALLFAVHPLRVESVAWVAERKDLLFALFWLLAIHGYSRWVERPTRGRYLTVFAFFIASLMSKPTAVMLPVLLLLLDFWPLRRTVSRDLLLEKLPLFAASAAAAWLTFQAQSSIGATALLGRPIPLTLRLANAAVNYLEYLRLTVWPAGLSYLYPYRWEPSPVQVAAAFAILAICFALAWRFRHRRPELLFGLGWFVLAIVPNAGFVQAGVQSHADRFTYAAHLGLLPALTLLVPLRRISVVLAALACLVFGWAAWRQAAVWRDGRSLATQADRASGGQNAIALNKLAVELAASGDSAAALTALTDAVRLDPALPSVRITLAAAYLGSNMPRLALGELAAVRDPASRSSACLVAARALLELAQTSDAEQVARDCLTQRSAASERSTIHRFLAQLAEREGNRPRALDHLRHAARLQPFDRDVQMELAGSLRMQGQRNEAKAVLDAIQAAGLDRIPPPPTRDPIPL